jgi:hypothetical protein
VRASRGWTRPRPVIGWALAHHGLDSCLGLASSLRVWKRRASAFGRPFGWPRPAIAIGWAPAHHELDSRLGLVSSFRCWKRRASAFGQPFGWPRPAIAIGWALAHHELQPRLGVVVSLCRLKRRARAFGPSYGRPESLSLAWPLRRRSGANAEGGLGGAEGRMPGVRESNQREGHPSSAPFAHPCAKGSRESVGVFGQAIPGLSKTLAASLRPTLRADRPPPAASQGPREERGLRPAGATARECVGSRAAAGAQAQAQAQAQATASRAHL